jgi:hypothetical protein
MLKKKSFKLLWKKQKLVDVNASIEEERNIKNKCLEHFGLTDNKANAMS